LGAKVEVDGEIIDLERDEFNPGSFAPWYEQLMLFEEKKRLAICRTALKRLKENRPETYQFIKDGRCKLVGIAPSIEYTLVEKSEGDLDVTFSHAFSMPTLLYWHPKGKIAILVNANLEFNNTVLNKVRGNKSESIRGFTG
jgi:hypothetical protein